jgi:hypothetical protein
MAFATASGVAGTPNSLARIEPMAGPMIGPAIGPMPGMKLTPTPISLPISGAEPPMIGLRSCQFMTLASH